MQWVPKVLKHPIVKESVRSFGLKPELPQEFEFLFGKIAAQHGILQEIGEPGLVPVSMRCASANVARSPFESCRN